MNPTNCQIVIAALQNVVSHPDHNEQTIAHYFSTDYQQRVDGHLLDYAGFVQHMALLKSQTERMAISVVALVADEQTVFTHHQVRVEKRGGEYSEFEVMARFTLQSGRIVGCEELTRMVSGSDDDRDLASRRQGR